MMDKANGCKYTDTGAFRAVVKLIVSNCKLYWADRYPWLVDDVKKLQRAFHDILENHDAESAAVMDAAKRARASCVEGGG